MSAPEPGYLTAEDASSRLGVKRATLYAYASRGLIRTAPGPSGRERLYLVEDLERLRAKHQARAGHAAVAAGALRWGEPVLDSSITEITPRGPRYRGLLATQLARADAPFEAVAELLWTGAQPERLPSSWRARAAGVPIAALQRLVAPDAPPLTVMGLAAHALGAAAPDRHLVSGERELDAARTLLPRLAALLAVSRGAADVARALGAPDVASCAALALGADTAPQTVRAINRALIVSADHELNASSFAARLAASTGADLYACVGAALGVLSGPLHGGSTDRVEALVDEVRQPGRAKEIIRARARRGELPPGFGHVLYPGGDARAVVLLETAVELRPRNSRLRTLLAVVEEVEASGAEPPTLDTGLVAVAMAAGLPPGSAAGLFALGRMAGWVAHLREQRAAGTLLRPRARYVGPPRR